MSAIVAILNTFAPATGANVAQVVFRSDGTVEIFGDDALARFTVGKLVDAQLPAADSAPARFAGPILRGLGRERRAERPFAVDLDA